MCLPQAIFDGERKKLLTDIDQLQQLVTSREQESKVVRAKCETQCESFTKKSKAIWDRLQVSQREVGELKREKDVLCGKLERAQTTLSGQTMTIDELKKKGKAIQERERQMNSDQVQVLKGKMHVLQEERAQLDRQTNELQLALRNARRAWAQEKHVLNMSIDEAYAKIHKEQEKAAQHEDEMRRMESRVQSAEAQHETVAEEFEDLLAELRKSQGNATRADTMVETMENRVGHRLKEVDVHVAKLRMRAERAEAVKAELEGECEAANAELEGLRAKLLSSSQEADYEVSTAMSQFHLATERAHTLTSENKRLSEAKADYERRVAVAEDQLKAMADTLTTERRKFQDQNFQWEEEKKRLVEERGVGGEGKHWATLMAELEVMRQERQELAALVDLLVAAHKAGMRGDQQAETSVASVASELGAATEADVASDKHATLAARLQDLAVQVCAEQARKTEVEESFAAEREEWAMQLAEMQDGLENTVQALQTLQSEHMQSSSAAQAAEERASLAEAALAQLQSSEGRQIAEHKNQAKAAQARVVQLQDELRGKEVRLGQMQSGDLSRRIELLELDNRSAAAETEAMRLKWMAAQSRVAEAEGRAVAAEKAAEELEGQLGKAPSANTSRAVEAERRVQLLEDQLSLLETAGSQYMERHRADRKTLESSVQELKEARQDKSESVRCPPILSISRFPPLSLALARPADAVAAETHSPKPLRSGAFTSSRSDVSTRKNELVHSNNKWRALGTWTRSFHTLLDAPYTMGLGSRPVTYGDLWVDRLLLPLFRLPLG